MTSNLPNACNWFHSMTAFLHLSNVQFSGVANIPYGLKYTWTPGTQLPIRTFSAVTAITNNSATISWTPPTNANSYNVKYREHGSCDWTLYNGNPINTNSVTLSNLNPSTTYDVTVQAINNSITSIFSHIPSSNGTGTGLSSGTFTTASSLAVVEPDNTIDKILIYPNPFSSYIIISDIKNVKSISLTDITGKKVKHFNKIEASLDLKHLKSGIYFILLEMKDGSRQLTKAIKL